MTASDYVPIFFKSRLHLVGRPQMGSRPSNRFRQKRTSARPCDLSTGNCFFRYGHPRCCSTAIGRNLLDGQ